MISRFYLEDYLSFKNIDIEFNKGLIVFSGPSGAGKSIFMNAMLSLFGKTDTKSKISEISIEDIDIKNYDYLINNDEFVIKQNTNTKTRYFLNNQSIPKKNLNLFCNQFFKHLHLKDTSDFNSENIIEFLDFLSSKNDKNFTSLMDNFRNNYNEISVLENKLKQVTKDEKNIEDLQELARLQIKNIVDINPIDGEYEELKNLKDIISKKDKIDEILLEAKPLLNNSNKISKVLGLLDIDSSFFDDAINEVNNHFENFYDKLLTYDEGNIEDTLDRIESLSKLIKKYGSVEEALTYKKEKELELDSYDNISFEKEILIKNIAKLKILLTENSSKISIYRRKALVILQKDINDFLKYLYLDNLTILIDTKSMDITGNDFISFKLNNIDLSKLSSGEFNRLRLALLTSRSLYEINKNGILFLDEIDANLSGKESQSIAKVLKVLSKNYQIFAISHQPQLSSTANEHFLITKENNTSVIKLLNKEQRISELARMISGENITEEAISFAKKLLIAQ